MDIIYGSSMTAGWFMVLQAHCYQRGEDVTINGCQSCLTIMAIGT